MTSRVRLATNAQIWAMAFAWLGVCMGIDYTFNRHLWAATAQAPPSSTTTLSLRINHLCCSGCLDDVKKALIALPWLQDASLKMRAGNLRSQEQAEVAGPVGDYGGWLDIAVPDVLRIDFVALDQALRGAGFVASQIQFGGPRHFRLEAEVRHLCCPMCKDACERLPELGKTRQAGRLRWLDSVSADRAGSRVLFHVRYQEPDSRIDVTEILATMDEVGLPPFSLRVKTGIEDAPAPAAPRKDS